MFDYFDELSYVEGCEPDGGPEAVSYVLKSGGGKGLVIADFLMIAPWRTQLTAGRPQQFTEKHIDEVVRFIRHSRDAIKFGRPGKSYAEWCALDIPLEDYLPLNTTVESEWMQFSWLDEPAWRNEAGQEIRQWAASYMEPCDRSRHDHPLYHTFCNMDGEWKYCGICQQGDCENQVPELEFYGKLEFPDSGRIGGISLYYRSESEIINDFRHWKTINRPVNLFYLTMQEYGQELESGMGREANCNPTGPLSDREIAWVSETIMYRLYSNNHRNDNNTRLPGHYEIQISNRVIDRVKCGKLQSFLAALVDEIPHRGVQVRTIPGKAVVSCYLYFPYEEKEAREGVKSSECKKRFRDSCGRLTCTTNELAQKTRAEADDYYRHGEEYIIKGKCFTCYRYTDTSRSPLEMCLFSDGIYNVYSGVEDLGTHLPDVASNGREYVAVRDKRYQPMACLTKSLRAYVARKMEEE